MDTKEFNRNNEIIEENLSKNKNYESYKKYTDKISSELNIEHFCKYFNNVLYKRIKDKEYFDLFLDEEMK